MRNLVALRPCALRFDDGLGVTYASVYRRASRHRKKLGTLCKHDADTGQDGLLDICDEGEKARRREGLAKP